VPEVETQALRPPQAKNFDRTSTVFGLVFTFRTPCQNHSASLIIDSGSRKAKIKQSIIVIGTGDNDNSFFAGMSQIFDKVGDFASAGLSYCRERT
jgi:hypothetical protein